MKEELQKIFNEIIASQWSTNEDEQEIVKTYEAIIEFCQNLERESSRVYDVMLESENDNNDVEFEKFNNK